jgi:hypothetical protein
MATIITPSQLNIIMVLYRSGLNKDVISIILSKVKDDAVNKIANYWQSSISKLTDSLSDHIANQSEIFNEKDIRVLFSLRTALSVRSISLDYHFWYGYVDAILTKLFNNKYILIGDTMIEDYGVKNFYLQIGKCMFYNIYGKVHRSS